MPIPFLNLHAQYLSIQAEIDLAIARVVETSAFAGGIEVERFEEAFAMYCDVQHCKGVGSGTAALELLLRAYDIGPGDEVVTAANSYIATAEAISLVGATPVLVDCEERTALIDSTAIEHVITDRTKAIIPVHLYGQIADMGAIMEIADQHQLTVIEDACQAQGSFCNDQKAGSIGHSAAFSFYPGKNLGAMGDAGAITTNDIVIAERIALLRDHGSRKKYEHQILGMNHRMDGLQAAILDVKLRHLDGWNAARATRATIYDQVFTSCDAIKTFDLLPGNTTNHHLYVIRVSERESLMHALDAKEIQTGIHYPIPIHKQPAYADTDLAQQSFPISELLADEILSIPLYPEMTEDQVRLVSEIVLQHVR